jgi:hypothetical protein
MLARNVEIFNHHVGSTGAPSRKTVFIRATNTKQWEVSKIATNIIIIIIIITLRPFSLTERLWHIQLAIRLRLVLRLRSDI